MSSYHKRIIPTQTLQNINALVSSLSTQIRPQYMPCKMI